MGGMKLKNKSKLTPITGSTEYRFESDEVRIRRRGSAIILEPIATNWTWLDALTGQLDDDFVKAVTEPVPVQARKERLSSHEVWG
jgi:antitoxin VapB